jgi:hypothetical protein
MSGARWWQQAAEVRGDAKITQLSSWNNFQKFELVCQAIVESVACTALDPRNLNGAGRAFHFESEKWKTPPKNKSSTGLTNSGSKPESPMGGTRSSIIKPNKSYGTRIDPLHCALPTTFNPGRIASRHIRRSCGTSLFALTRRVDKRQKSEHLFDGDTGSVVGRLICKMPALGKCHGCCSTAAKALLFIPRAGRSAGAQRWFDGRVCRGDAAAVRSADVLFRRRLRVERLGGALYRKLDPVILVPNGEVNRQTSYLRSLAICEAMYR